MSTLDFYGYKLYNPNIYKKNSPGTYISGEHWALARLPIQPSGFAIEHSMEIWKQKRGIIPACKRGKYVGMYVVVSYIGIRIRDNTYPMLSSISMLVVFQLQINVHN